MNCALNNTGDLLGSKRQENRDAMGMLSGCGAGRSASRAGGSVMSMG